jgi:hypothetical protein
MLRQLSATIATTLVLIASSAYAAPNTINYQGRLTDPSGAPVPDGQYLMRFNVYDAQSGGVSLWNSGFLGIPVVGGLFQYNLGDTTALPDLLFDGEPRWLGVQIGADPEMAPRTEFEPNAYSLRAFDANNANNADSLGALPASSFLHQGIDTLQSGTWQLQTSDGEPAYSFRSFGRRFRVSKSGTGAAELSSDSLNGGQLNLLGGSGGRIWGFGGGSLTNLDAALLVLSSLSSAGGVSIIGRPDHGQLVVGDTSGIPTISMRAVNPFTATDSARDANVFLGSGAINQTEILDEPGIAANSTPSNITWPLFPTLADILTVTITIPNDGYVVVEGTTVLRFADSPAGRLAGQMQIDTISGGTLESPHTSWAGVANVPSPPLYQSGVARRVYFFSEPGTHTFRLEATQTTGDVGSSIQSINTWLQATYFRTGYGSVATVTSNPGDNPSATSITVMSEDGSAERMYKVDLRHYELRVLQAQLDAERAEMRALKAEAELRRAQMNQSRDN